MNLPLKHSFCFLQAYNKIMTSRTKRINRAMTTPITEAMETGSEMKENNNNNNYQYFGIWNMAKLYKKI